MQQEPACIHRGQQQTHIHNVLCAVSPLLTSSTIRCSNAAALCCSMHTATTGRLGPGWEQTLDWSRTCRAWNFAQPA